MSKEIKLTHIRVDQTEHEKEFDLGSAQKIGKSAFFIDREQGKVGTTAAGVLARGTGRVITLDQDSPGESLSNLIRNLDGTETIVHGVPKPGLITSAEFSIVTRRMAGGGKYPGAIARTKDNFIFGGSMNFDADDIGAGNPVSTPEEFIETMIEVFPEFSGALQVISYSASSNICDSESLQEYIGARGFHLYMFARNPSDIQRFTDVLFKRLWLAGHGYIKISIAGKPLLRTIFDKAVFTAERPDFIGPIDCEEGLMSCRPSPVVIEGGLLDTEALQDLTETEERDFHRLVVEAKRERADEIKIIRNKYIESRSQEIQKATNCTPKEATFIIAARLQGELLPSDVIFLDTGERVTVADILLGGVKYDEATCADPLEPDYMARPGEVTRGKAIILINADKGAPVVYSYAHGGQLFKIFYDLKTLKKQLTQIIDNYRFGEIAEGDFGSLWPLPFKRCRLTASESDEIKNWLCSLDQLGGFGIGKRTINAELKNHAAPDRVSAKEDFAGLGTESVAGKETVSYDDMNPHVMLDQMEDALLLHPHDEPIYQRSGGYITLTEKIPDSSSEAKNRDALAPSPTIVYYRAESLDTRISKSVHLQEETQTEDGPKFSDKPLPSKVAKALLHKVNKRVQNIVGLLEHPIIDDKGRLLNKAGYDPDTMLYFYMNPDYFLPVSQEPGDAETEEAKAVITEEFFLGFEFAGDLDRTIAVAMLIGKFRRMFMAGCPGNLINASEQNSGKTALGDLICSAVDGRQPAHDVLPIFRKLVDDSELRKKMTTYLKDGQRSCFFDNVPDDFTLVSSVLSMIITSSTYSDRLLGLNEVATVATTIFIVLTGNRIVIAKDMKTRILECQLQPTVLAAERDYERQDLEGWVFMNRKRIIWALMTLLRRYHLESNSSADPDSFIELNGSVRFSDWNKLVRKPTAWLTGVDPADGFIRNETEHVDQKEQENLALIMGWGDDPAMSRPMTSEGLVRHIEKVKAKKGAVLPDHIAILERLGEGDSYGSMTADKLGYKLRSLKNRHFAECRRVLTNSRANKNSKCEWFIS